MILSVRQKYRLTLTHTWRKLELKLTNQRCLTEKLSLDREERLQHSIMQRFAFDSQFGFVIRHYRDVDLYRIIKLYIDYCRIAVS